MADRNERMLHSASTPDILPDSAMECQAPHPVPDYAPGVRKTERKRAAPPQSSDLADSSGVSRAVEDLRISTPPGAATSSAPSNSQLHAGVMQVPSSSPAFAHTPGQEQQKQEVSESLIKLGETAIITLTRMPHILAINGDFQETVKNMLSENPYYLGVKDSLGDIPLFTALQKGHLEIALMIAEVMIVKLPAVFHFVNTTGHTALHTAAGCESQIGLKIMKIIINAGVNITATDVENGRTVLHFCAEEGFSQSLQCITENATDKNCYGQQALDIADNDGRTALHVAIHHGHLECVAALLEVGADRNKHRLSSGDTPIMEAIDRLVTPFGSERELEMIRLLLSRSKQFVAASPNLRRFTDRATPLHLLLMPREIPAKQDLVVRAAQLLRDNGARTDFRLQESQKRLSTDSDSTDDEMVYTVPMAGQTPRDLASLQPNAEVLLQVMEQRPGHMAPAPEKTRVHVLQTTTSIGSRERRDDSGLGSSAPRSSRNEGDRMQAGSSANQQSSGRGTLSQSAGRKPKVIPNADVPERDLVSSIPEADRQLLDQKLSKKWRPVLKRLGLATGELDIAGRTRKPVVFSFAILIAKRVTIDEFVKALIEENCNDCAELLRDIYNEEARDSDMD